MASAKKTASTKGSADKTRKLSVNTQSAPKNTNPTTIQRFGAHVSVSGGLETAFVRSIATGCDCIQIFVKNQRQWKAKPLNQAQINAFKTAHKQTTIDPVFAHASYLLNLASPEAEMRQMSIDAMVDELERCEALGIVGLVFHPGSHKGAGVEAGLRLIAESLDVVHQRTSGFKTKTLLEVTAGQGSALGHEFLHLARIIEQVDSPERVRVCLDTCHLFVAGYDFRKEDEYARMLDDMSSTVTLDRIRCIHTNDSKTACGSRVDRHEHINQGHIGETGFTRLLNDERLAHVPRILETDKGDDDGIELDRMNLKRLREMVHK